MRDKKAFEKTKWQFKWYIVLNDCLVTEEEGVVHQGILELDERKQRWMKKYMG